MSSSDGHLTLSARETSFPPKPSVRSQAHNWLVAGLIVGWFCVIMTTISIAVGWHIFYSNIGGMAGLLLIGVLGQGVFYGSIFLAGSVRLRMRNTDS